MADPTERPMVLITGAAGDIGRACALTLVDRGWSVALADHEVASARLAETADLCRGGGATTYTTTFDVTAGEAVQSAIDNMVTAVGAPRGLFNNAGYQGTFAPIDRYPLDDARRIFDVNVLGVFNVLAVVGAAMVRAGQGGAVVNMGSMAGVGGAANMPAYSASKAAVVGLTKSAAKDLAPAGIRVNAVSPAFIGPGVMWDRQVAMQAEVGSQYYSSDPIVVAGQMINMVPLRRYGSTHEVAKVVAFLMSDEASYLTGVNIEVSGGSG